MDVNSGDRGEAVLKVDAGAGGGRIWRESSYDFLGDLEKGDGEKMPEKGSGTHVFDLDGGGSTPPSMEKDDPPSKLIGRFLHKQKDSGEVCLDMDLEMSELQDDAVVHHNLPPVMESPRTAHSRVSFDPNPPSSTESVRRRHPRNTDNVGEVEVPKSSSRNDMSFPNSSSFKRKSSLLKGRTKSRLMDPPPHPPEKSGRAGRSRQLKSGFLGKGSGGVDEEEDDPLLEEDLPDEFKREKADIWVLLEWVSLILIIGALVCSLTIPYLRDKTLWKLKLWKWGVLILVLICGRLVSGWMIKVIVFFIERNFLLRKRVLYFVYGIKTAVQNCLWLGLVLVAWHFLFDKKVERETGSRSLRTVTKVLVCLVVGTLLWLVKTLVVKVLASSFHVSTYFDRIQESLFNQYVIEILSGPPLIEIKNNEEEEERIAAEVLTLQNAGAAVPPSLKATVRLLPRSTGLTGSGRIQTSPRINTPRLSHAFSNKFNKGDEGITIDHLHKLNPKNVSAWNMKRLMNIILFGTLSTLDEHINDTNHDDDDESATKIRSEIEAKAAARKIFQNVAKPGSRYIYLNDIMRFMHEDEASKAMSLFEGASETKRVSKKCLKNWVVNAFRERRALAFTLNDTKTAVNKLHRMVNFLVGILIIIIWLLILEIATGKLLFFICSQLLLVAFIFGNTCKTVFEAIIFLFVIHPFDVGDRCEIDGVQMVVEEMNILTTVFLRYDNQKIIIANSVLATKSISNFYRSPDMGDAVEFLVHIATPAEKIALMKQRITSYIENNKEHWYPAPSIVFKDVEELNRVRIAVWLTHRMNHQDMGERWSRRALLVEEMVKIFKELDIQYRLLPIDINVRVLPPVTSERLTTNQTS